MSSLPQLLQTAALFCLTAIAEIAGCFIPGLWLRKDASPWLLLPAAASRRVYAAYGGVDDAAALCDGSAASEIG
jgi:small multidrug resistance family-3 protein